MKKYILGLVFTFVGYSNALMAQYTNNCGYAGTALTVGASCTTVDFNSTNNSNLWTSAAGCNASPSYDDAWWWFTATSTSTTITYNSANDAILHLLTGACSATMGYLACSDNTSSGNETITYATTIGTNYAIRIQRYNSDNNMNGTICVYSSGGGGGGCTNTSSWGSATAPTDNNPVTISTCNYQDEYNTISGVVAGNTYQSGSDCGGYITVRSGTSGGAVVASGNAPLSWTATVSGTHYIHYNTNSSCGTASSCCTTTLTCTSCSAPVAPPNDLCSGATNLPCGTTALAGTTVNTTNTAHGTACTMSNYGVWYTFVGDGNNTTIDINNSYDIELSISYGSCGSFTNVVCTDFPEDHTFTTINGATYYVYVAYWTTGSTTGTFDITRTCSAPGAECTPNTVIASLPYVQTGFNTSGAGDDFDNADACASYYMNGDDYVFTYTPATDVCVNIALTNTSTWVGLFVTQGCPTTGTCVAYNTNSSGNPSVEDVYLTGGVEYFITVSTNPSPQTTPFDISVTTCPPPITACSGTFYDSGGPGGQYANNEYTKTTYCSGSTDCISFNFTSFNTESGWDYLDVYDGPSTSSPYIDSYSGTELNGVTLTSSGSCLTFVFDSDGSTSAAGWAANISCAACPPPPPPVAQDCAGGTSICSDASFSGNSDGYGFIEELNSSNDDCLSGENQTSWYFFEAATAGTLEFGIKPQNGTDDYDFAMWGPYPSGSTPTAICPPAGAPVRCSYSAGAPNPATGTGLMSGAGDTSEGVSGDDVVNPLVLNVGDVYILVIDNYSSTTSPFDMDLSLTGGLTLNCNQLPIELISFDGFAEDGFNLLKWSTAVEINNNYFEIEKSLNGMLFEKIAQVTGAGNSNTVNNYQFIDNDAYKGVSYYRLKQIDYDGAMSYSSVVAVKQSLRAEVSIFPNPTVDKVKMNFVSKEDGVYRIVVSDVSKVIYERTLAVARGNKIVNFDSFNELAKGFYIIQIIDENGNIIKTERVVKQ